MRTVDLSGTWELPDWGSAMRLPGTLDEAGIGAPDDPSRQWKVDEVRRIGLYRDGDPIVTRLTRLHSQEGPVRLRRSLRWDRPDECRVFAECERARKLSLRVNGREAPLWEPQSLSGPCVFEVSDLARGEDTLEFTTDNSYPGWPRDAIVYASAASDETQTNWNGLLGYVRLRVEKPDFLSCLRAEPHGDSLLLHAELDSLRGWTGTLRVHGDALEKSVSRPVSIGPGRHDLRLTLPLKPGLPRWDLGRGILHSLTVDGGGLEARTLRFGLRDFRAEDGSLHLNGRRIFLRGETNCAVFPETGFCPMDTEDWRDILRRFMAYGVNCMRFHSHCPPEAAFTAADELGMLMQPELSHWNPTDAFASEEARRYYRRELRQIQRMLANHPSFVMLTFGNELQADEAGHAFMDSLLREARAFDPTRLYAGASNAHYGQRGPDPASDFFTAMACRGIEMRATCDGMTGWLNRGAPDFRRHYGAAVKAVRKETGQPVFSFEVGQYEVLPDFDELDAYRGVTRPDNLRHILRKVEAQGLTEDWKHRVEATGELSLLCYRAEVEAALRTTGYSGISLLGLQDFPGQGTALVGMMNAHLRPKPYAFAQPERFAAFFRDTLPLALLPRFTFTAGETAEVRLCLAHYGRERVTGPVRWSLTGDGLSLNGALRDCDAPAGSLTELGSVTLALPRLQRAARLTFRIDCAGHGNDYPLWVYPDAPSVCPPGVHECRALDEEALRVLRAGGTVYLSPDADENMPHSVRTQFSTDFWSVCTFPHQTGCMGQLIDTGHPVFRDFPTDPHTDWQWWPMANQRAFVLPERRRAIVEEMDSYAFLRPMAQLIEGRCAGGRLLASSMALHQLQAHPEARALQRSVYAYLASDRFDPKQALDPVWFR